MENIRRIHKTNLARDTRQLIQYVQGGKIILIENRRRDEAAILDISNYCILRAVTTYFAHPAEIDSKVGLNKDALATLTASQKVYDLVIAYYLADAISLGRVAELLDLPWLELRDRLMRLNIPMKLGVKDENEALGEAQGAGGVG